MMQYNILCTVKRFEAYETIGGLFTEVTNDTLELSVTDKIWAIILDFVLEAAERFSIDATELLADFIESNPVAHTLHNMYIYEQAVDINSSLKFEIKAKRLYAASQRVL